MSSDHQLQFLCAQFLLELHFLDFQLPHFRHNRPNISYVCVVCMRSSFLNLPIDVLSTVLQEWLSLCDLVNLDSSVCERSLRKTFLSHLTYLQLKGPHTPSKTDCAYYGWAFHRNFQVLRLQLHDWYFVVEKRSTLQNVMKILGYDPNRNPMYKWLKVWLPAAHSLLELHLVTTVGNDVLNNVIFALIGQSCPHLQSIALSSAPTGFILPSLLPIVSGCKALTNVFLRGCVLTNDQIDILPTQLKSFSIHYTNHHAMCKAALIRLGQRCTCLHKLDIYSMLWERERDPTDRSMPTDVFRVIGAHFPHLSTLSISTRIQHAECCTNLSLYCPQLHELRLSGFNAMTNQIVCEFLRMPLLQVLKITCTRNSAGHITLMDGDTLLIVSRSKITHMEFSDFVGLTDSGLLAILRCCPELSNLYIRLSSLLTPFVVDALTEHCPKLLAARFVYCYGITTRNCVLPGGAHVHVYR